jgi:hypothetical protein
VVYKRRLPFRQGVRDPFPPLPRELLELSGHPFVTPIHLQYLTARRSAITSKEEPKPGWITVCFVVSMTTSELEHAILITLFLLVQKTLTHYCPSTPTESLRCPDSPKRHLLLGTSHSLWSALRDVNHKLQCGGSGHTIVPRGTHGSQGLLHPMSAFLKTDTCSAVFRPLALLMWKKNHGPPEVVRGMSTYVSSMARTFEGVSHLYG